MKKTFLLVGLFFLFIGTCSPVLADEADDELDLLLDSLDIEEDYKYEFPEIEPSAHFHLGYRFVDLDGSSQVFEYEYLENSVAAGGELRLFNFPHRFFLDVDFVNKEDYFGEIRYAYSDLVTFRWLNNSYFHNLENIRLQSFDPLTSSPDADGTQDAGRDYGIGVGQNKINLVVKAPNFPLHTYFSGFYMAKDGDAQQRNLGGSGWFNNMLLYSQGRSVDNVTSIYKIGANSHLGLVEVDFAHIEKRFSVDSDPAMVETYTASGFRPAGDYAHSLTPELEGSGNILKIHSSYTGKWVGSATLLQNERENNYSGAESEMIVGTGSVRWSPLTSLTLALNYRHRDLDNESPATVTVTNLDPPPVCSDTYAVRQPISSNSDTLSLSGRYKPVKGLTFRGKYVFQKIDRTNGGAWNLTDSTTKNTITLVADSRLHSKVLFNIKYAYQNISDPAYNTDPEHSHTGRIDLTWLPHPKFNMIFSYDLNRQERDTLNFISTDEARYREADTDNLLVMGTYQVSKKFTFNASYSYLQYEV
ncbi:MAG: MtrB/PioB family outer membrane beta-barrel protein, partial [Thermodesulfovibrionia bacterium]|nr:MtrB/PioB family outer membrane beta-barrel protein [Thermodesulfovibrionia bacterium]